MREISAKSVTELVAALCRKANTELPRDVVSALAAAHGNEPSEAGRAALSTILENADFARLSQLPICQDTGLCVVFVSLGQEVHISGGALSDAIQTGVARGYTEGYLRKSVVGDPLQRENTGDNTPAVIHYDIVPGDKLIICVAPKGFGSENMTALRMFEPGVPLDDIERFVVERVHTAGANPCPPIVVGIGLGGTAESCLLSAKKALTRPLDSITKSELYRALEDRLLSKINALGIGPQGFGGRNTALRVFVEPRATHIAGLPCAVCLGCHVHRHAEGVL